MNDQQRAVMQMALDALHNTSNALLFVSADGYSVSKMAADAYDDAEKAITALREALAQPTPQEITVFEGYISSAQTEALQKALAQPQVSDYDREFWGDGQPHPPHRCCECEECVAYFVIRSTPIMDKEEIIRIAHEAGITQAVSRDPTYGTFYLLERFATMVEAATKEKAAKVCEECGHCNECGGGDEYAAAIRSMK